MLKGVDNSSNLFHPKLVVFNQKYVKMKMVNINSFLALLATLCCVINEHHCIESEEVPRVGKLLFNVSHPYPLLEEYLCLSYVFATLHIFSSISKTDNDSTIV